ncbi:hypothetical protein Fot_11472 [Forsythia ovata]|uniref:Uncharacterized protein n=1 Tax=Forsythia ovata TaxID=205694 RepID=A0ABD1WJS1_9LAMI
MSGFYFSSVPKLRIRRGGVVDDVSHPPSVPSVTPDPGVTVLQTPEIMVGGPSFVPLAPEVTSEVPSALFPARPVPSSGNARQSGKRKAGANSEDEAFWAPTPPPPPPSRYEYINIASHRDKLDPMVLEKLLSPLPKRRHQFISIGLMPLGGRQITQN